MIKFKMLKASAVLSPAPSARHSARSAQSHEKARDSAKGFHSKRCSDAHTKSTEPEPVIGLSDVKLITVYGKITHSQTALDTLLGGPSSAPASL